MEGFQEIEYRPIPGFPRYRAGSHGSIQSRRGTSWKTLRPWINRRGRPQVDLCLNGMRHTHEIHGLIALAFLGPRPDGQQVRHLNGDKADNRVVNLAYGDSIAQTLDDVRNGRLKMSPARVLAARTLARDGWRATEIGAVLGVNPATVHAVLSGRSWAWVTPASK